MFAFVLQRQILHGVDELGEVSNQIASECPLNNQQTPRNYISKELLSFSFLA